MRATIKIRKLSLALLCAGWMAIAPTLVQAQPMLLNFRGVDIRQIIETVGELTGRNFLIDPRVKAKVTILANTEVPADALYDVFLSILAMHGFRAVEGPGMTRILPVNISARFPPNKESEELITEILRIQNLAAQTIVPIIKPLLTQQAQVAVHKESNLILMTETLANVERIKTIIGKIDLKTLLDYEVIQLHHILATDAVKVIARSVPKSVRGLIEIISESESNRIILTGSPDVRLSVRALLAELDTPAKLSKIEGALRVYPLKFAKAEDVETIISSLLNSRFLESAAAETKKTTTKKTTKKKTAKKTTVTAKKNRNQGKKYVVQSDPATNSIIVGGTPEVLDILDDIIQRLDVPRPQVLIEAIIADVTDNKIEELGSQIRLAGALDSRGNLTDTARSNYTGLLGIFADGTLQLGGQAITRSGGAAREYLPINILINAIRQNDDAEVLSTPSILTLNNESAVIDVSDERSVLTGDTSTGDNVNNVRRTYERIKFGTRLEVLPQITEGNAVRLEIRQVVEDIVNDGAEVDRPNTRSREIETTVVVDDGDILVLGGLARNSRSLSDNKVPLLGSIPFLGDLLFRDRTDTALHTNLVLFIRPIILRTAEDSARLSKDRYAAVRMRQLLQLEDTKQRGLLEDAESETVLPRLKSNRKLKSRNVERSRRGYRNGEPPRKRRVIKRKKRRNPSDV